MSLKTLAMRRHVRVGVPPPTEEEKTPQPAEKSGVVHRYRVSPHEVHGRGRQSTAAEQLEKIVGEPSEGILGYADPVTLGEL